MRILLTACTALGAIACGSSDSGNPGIAPGASGAPNCGPDYRPFQYGAYGGQAYSPYTPAYGNRYVPTSMDYFVSGNQPLHYRQTFDGMTPGALQEICGSVHTPGRPNPPAFKLQSYYYGSNLGSWSNNYFKVWYSFGRSSGFRTSGFSRHSYSSSRSQTESQMFQVAPNEVVVQTRDVQNGGLLIVHYRLQ